MVGIVVLTTKRLYLRTFTLEDAPLLHELDSDPEVMRYISGGKPTPLAVYVERKLPQWVALYGQGEGIGFWAVQERDTDDFVGWFHLRPDRDEPDAMELGYRFHRRVWGKGYATEGSLALIEKAFTDWGVDKVVARTLIGNRASQRVMEKCGLVFESEFWYALDRLPDWTEDERHAVKYALDRTGWERSQKQAL